MTAVTVKLRSIPNRAEGTVREQWFVGPDAGHLQLAGEITLRLGEWQLIGAAMLFGHNRLSHVMTVITEGDDAVIKAFSDDG